MDGIAIGFWGAYFGVAVLAFVASAVPLTKGLPKVAVLMGAAPVLNGLYVAAALGWYPGGVDLNLRVQSFMALHNSLALSALMLLMLRTGRGVWRAWSASLVVVVAVGAVALWMEPRSGMLLSTGYATACTWVALAMLFSPRALRHHRLAWLAVCSVASVSLGLIATAWIAAYGPSAPWQLHAGSAFIVSVHEVCMAAAVWSQIAHLTELRLVRAYGAGWDPVTRLRSAENAGQLINSVFSSRGDVSVGAIAITVSNLYALENLHGRAEHNQALFILASRLRNTLPRGVHIGRLGRDVFLLLMHRPQSSGYLLELAHRIHARLARPISLGSGDQPSEVHLHAHQWHADLGIGVLAAPPQLSGAEAVNMTRSMSRTALSYPSRIACFSEQERKFIEVPVRPQVGRRRGLRPATPAPRNETARSGSA